MDGEEMPRALTGRGKPVRAALCESFQHPSQHLGEVSPLPVFPHSLMFPLFASDTPTALLKSFWSREPLYQEKPYSLLPFPSNLREAEGTLSFRRDFCELSQRGNMVRGSPVAKVTQPVGSRAGL